MNAPFPPYGQSLSLLTDLYELTMASGYWKSDLAEREAVFHLYFRKNPFQGGYVVAGGLGPAVEFVRGFRFDETDLEYLRTLIGTDQKPLFEQPFLEYLEEMEFRCDIDAMPEGQIVFPQEPLVRVRGPLIECQLLESALLNVVNFQSLIATKALRVTTAAEGDPVLEFGLRRAQGVDGALAASRAAYLGGCTGTSNVLAGKLFGIPVKGTHAHSWVMSFDTEQEAFDTWADTMPNNSIFLVDTYDTLEGIDRAIAAGRRLTERGAKMRGIRLDSGDLVDLSREARRRLDRSGFEDARIVGSGDLDEHAIADLKRRGAKIDVWGVGTRLVTGHDDPALGGVYKLTAIRDESGAWSDRVKLSDDLNKISNPGVQQVRRYTAGGRFVGDVIYDERSGIDQPPRAVQASEQETPFEIPPDAEWQDLLQPIFRGGVCLCEPAPLSVARETVRHQREALDPEILRLTNPARYPVGLERRLWESKQELAARHGVSSAASD